RLESDSAGRAAIVASHIPMSSAWTMTTRSRRSKPSLRSSGLACVASGKPCGAPVISLPCFAVDRVRPIEAQGFFEYVQLGPGVAPYLFRRPLAARQSPSFARAVTVAADARQHCRQDENAAVPEQPDLQEPVFHPPQIQVEGHVAESAETRAADRDRTGR